MPWMRGRIPLLVSGNRLIAMGDLHADVAFQAKPGAEERTLVWTRAHEIV